MLEELEKLITFISKEYNRLYDEWKDSELFISINQKNIKENIY